MILFSTVSFNDLLMFEPHAMAWTNLSSIALGLPPVPSRFQGFTSSGGKLFVFGGWDGQGLAAVAYCD